MTDNNPWPDVLSYSMAPWGYCVRVEKTLHTKDRVVYSCDREGCARNRFDVSVDPNTHNIDQVGEMMRRHVMEHH